MSPFRNLIKGHLEKIKKLDIDMIAPSHGPIYQNPQFIVEAYEEWISDQPKNIVLMPWISMHAVLKPWWNTSVADSLKKAWKWNPMISQKWT